MVIYRSNQSIQAIAVTDLVAATSTSELENTTLNYIIFFLQDGTGHKSVRLIFYQINGLSRILQASKPVSPVASLPVHRMR